MVRWFDGSLVRWMLGKFDRSLVRWFVGSMNKTIVGSLVRLIYRHIFRHEGYVTFADLALSGLVPADFAPFFARFGFVYSLVRNICFKGLGKDRKECLFLHIEVDCLGAKSR